MAARPWLTGWFFPSWDDFTQDGGSALEKTNLVVGAVPAETAGALYIAQERGIFAAHGLHVTVKPITSTIDIIPDMLHGSIDIASGQIPGFITAEAQGVGSFHLLASGLTLTPGVNEIVALKSSGITSGSQLKGKTIAENALVGDAALLVDSELAVYGTKPGQVTPEVLPFPAMGAALAAHHIDAPYCTEPYCTIMEQKYGARVVADVDQGRARSLLISGYTVTAAWLKKYPHTAAAFAASIAAARASTWPPSPTRDLRPAPRAGCGRVIPTVSVLSGLGMVLTT